MTALNSVSSYPKLAFRGVTWIRTTNKQITAAYCLPLSPCHPPHGSDRKLEFSDSWLGHLKTAAEACKHLSVHGGGGKHEHADARSRTAASWTPSGAPTSRAPTSQQDGQKDVALLSQLLVSSAHELDLITIITIISVSITCLRDKQRRNEA